MVFCMYQAGQRAFDQGWRRRVLRIETMACIGAPLTRFRVESTKFRTALGQRLCPFDHCSHCQALRHEQAGHLEGHGAC